MSKPAFPVSPEHVDAHEDWRGMTLRDYFAAKALPWCLNEFGGNADDQKQYAEAAYEIADAMMKAREGSR